MHSIEVVFRLIFMKHLLAFGLSAMLLAPSAVLAQDARQSLPVRIQVAPQNTATTLRVSATSQVKVLTSLGWKEAGLLLPESTLQVSAQGSGLKVSGIPGSEIYRGLKLETPNDKAMVQINQAWYRGHLSLTPTAQGFSTVNEVSLEQYLYSVVPSEMPASWPMEALKSQAVAARTYALSHLGQHRKQGFDLAATTASQVYQGVKAEHPNSIQAVEATRGQILTHSGKPIYAYFHSTSGGMTENGADLWAAMPYLKPVEDFDNASPKHIWYAELSQSQMQQRLRDELKVNVGQVLFLSPAQLTQGGRIKTLRVHGTQGQKDVDGLKFRMAMKLNSTFFNVGAIDANKTLLKTPSSNTIPVSFQFAGRGWGHGLGMSQWGARQMALDGKSYQDILQHYYRGVKLEPLNPSAYQIASTL